MRPLNLQSKRVLVWLLAAVFACVTGSLAQADEKDELKARFKQRDAQLTKLKQQGKLGETWEGFVEPVKSDALDEAGRTLMDEENADRRRLYALIAREEKVKVADVGAQNGLRNFASAKPSEYLRANEGPWVRRGDVITFKREGTIGETWEGYIEAVNAQERDARVNAVVLVENSARKYLYKMEAHQKKTKSDQEAQRAGRENLQRAKVGEFIKNSDGQWQRKK